MEAMSEERTIPDSVVEAVAESYYAAMPFDQSYDDEILEATHAMSAAKRKARSDLYNALLDGTAQTFLDKNAGGFFKLEPIKSKVAKELAVAEGAWAVS
jgi:hypothetical protein